MTWKQAANIASEVYGCFVDYEEGFFICPECDEPIYACDWQGHDFSTCPVCEFEMEET